MPAEKASQALDRIWASRIDLSEPGARVYLDSAIALWEELTEDQADPMFGITLAINGGLRIHGLLAYLMAASATGLDALHRMISFQAISKTGSKTALIIEGEHIHITETREAPVVWPDQLTESIVASLLVSLREISGTALIPVRAGFQHFRRRSPRMEEFFSCSVEFGAEANLLTFRRDDLGWQVRTRDPVLLHYLDILAAFLIKQIGYTGSLTDVIREAITKALPSGNIRLASIARDLGLAPRTLQRRLREHGTTFAALLESARRVTYAQLQAQEKANGAQAAFLLGYSDPSSLWQAKRRWKE